MFNQHAARELQAHCDSSEASTDSEQSDSLGQQEFKFARPSSPRQPAPQREGTAQKSDARGKAQEAREAARVLQGLDTQVEMLRAMLVSCDWIGRSRPPLQQQGIPLSPDLASHA